MSIKVKIGGLLFLAVAVILAAGYLSYQSMSSIVKSVHAEIEPSLTLNIIKDISNDLEKADRGIRIYTIMGDERYLKPYYSHIQKIDNQLNNLKAEMADDSLYIPVIDTLSYLISEKRYVWNEILNLYHDFNIENKLDEISLEVDTVGKVDTIVLEKKGFLKRLFKKEEGAVVVKQEPNMQLALQINDLKTTKFENDREKEKREIQLSNTNAHITQKLYNLIDVIEEEEDNKFQAKLVQAQTLSNKTYIWITAFAASGTILALIALFVVARFQRKTNQYQKALEESKKAAENLVKAKEMFIANVSHELRTPMNAIAGYTEQLILGGQVDQEYLKAIKFASGHLTDLINDLLDYSKLQAGKMTLHPCHFIVHDLVSDVLSIFKVQASKQETQLFSHFHKDIPAAVYGDPFHLKQILINLVGNAVKFTHKGQVHVNLYSKQLSGKLMLVLEIKDNGIGIEENKVAHIFDDFTQEDLDVSRKYGGTGLGLSIVKKLVELHKGVVEVDSAKNKGATFKCYLPYQIGEVNKVDKKPAFSEVPNLKGKKLLVVDDMEYNRELLKIVLQKWGALVFDACNGVEALEVLEKEKADMVILDIRMPVMDGYKTASYIRNELGMIELPIIVTSANWDEETISRFSGLGVDHVLVKPASEEALKKVLLNYFDKTSYSTKKNKVIEKDDSNEFHLLNIEPLKKMAGNDKGFIAEMLKNLIETNKKELEHLDQTYKNQQWQQMADVAHKMSPPCRHIEAFPLLKVLKEIENDARNEHEIEMLKEKLDLVKKMVGQLTIEVLDYLNTSSSAHH